MDVLTRPEAVFFSLPTAWDIQRRVLEIRPLWSYSYRPCANDGRQGRHGDEASFAERDRGDARISRPSQEQLDRRSKERMVGWGQDRNCEDDLKWTRLPASLLRRHHRIYGRRA